MIPEDRDLSNLIKTHATRHRVPPSLRSTIKAQLNMAELQTLGRARRAGRLERIAEALKGVHWSRWTKPAAAFACGMVAMALLMPIVEQARFQSGLDEAIVANHVRAVGAGPLFQVASSDRHTVKPWFQGKLDFAPTVLDFAGDGFALQGGRVEHVKGQTIAALAYRANQHVVDVYVSPSRGARGVEVRLVRGFAVVTWADASMQYWAVSDMDGSELQRLAALWTDRTRSIR